MCKSNPTLEGVVRDVTSKLLAREFYFLVAAQVWEGGLGGREMRGREGGREGGEEEAEKEGGRGVWSEM